jgi:hypothetical protein
LETQELVRHESMFDEDKNPITEIRIPEIGLKTQKGDNFRKITYGQ